MQNKKWFMIVKDLIGFGKGYKFDYNFLRKKFFYMVSNRLKQI